MSAYINSLRAKSAAAQAQRAEQERAAAQQAARERLTPLETRLSRLLETIPVELQQEGLSLPTLQASLRGRQGDKAHAGEIREALRRLGFWRERRWRGGDGFRAVWCKRP